MQFIKIKIIQLRSLIVQEKLSCLKETVLEDSRTEICEKFEAQIQKKA